MIFVRGAPVAGWLCVLSLSLFPTACAEELGWLENRNCVDVAVVKFLESHGRIVESDQYDAVLAKLGLDPNPRSRSVEDAISILHHLGERCIAFQTTSEDALDFKGYSIVYFQVRGFGGHTVCCDHGGEHPTIFDKRWIELTGSAWHRMGDLVLVVRRSSYYWYKLKFFVTWLLFGFLVGIAPIGSWSLLRSSGLWKRSNLLLIAGASLLGLGCDVDRPSKKTSSLTTHDFGIVSEDQMSHTFRISFPESRTIDRIRSSCSCLVVDSLEPGTVVPGGEWLEIPVTVDWRARIGAAIEMVIVSWKETNLEPLELKVKAFVVRSPVVSPDPISMQGTAGAQLEIPVDIAVAHGLATAPNLNAVQVVPMAEPTDLNITFEQVYRREGRENRNAGYVRLGYLVRGELPLDMQIGERREFEAKLQWSEPSLDRSVRIQVECVPRVQFTKQKEWLNFRESTTRRDLIFVTGRAGDVQGPKLSLQFDDPRLRVKRWNEDYSAFEIELVDSSEDSFLTTCRLLLDGEEVGSMEILVN